MGLFAMEKTIHYEGNKIKVRNNRITGVETVYYNDEEKSSGWFMFGGRQEFIVSERNKEVKYEVEISAAFPEPSVTIRRDGIIVFTDK